MRSLTSIVNTVVCYFSSGGDCGVKDPHHPANAAKTEHRGTTGGTKEAFTTMARRARQRVEAVLFGIPQKKGNEIGSAYRLRASSGKGRQESPGSAVDRAPYAASVVSDVYTTASTIASEDDLSVMESGRGGFQGGAGPLSFGAHRAMTGNQGLREGAFPEWSRFNDSSTSFQSSNGSNAGNWQAHGFWGGRSPGLRPRTMESAEGLPSFDLNRSLSAASSTSTASRGSARPVSVASSTHSQRKPRPVSSQADMPNAWTGDPQHIAHGNTDELEPDPPLTVPYWLPSSVSLAGTSDFEPSLHEVATSLPHITTCLARISPEAFEKIVELAWRDGISSVLAAEALPENSPPLKVFETLHKCRESQLPASATFASTRSLFETLVSDLRKLVEIVGREEFTSDFGYEAFDYLCEAHDAAATSIGLQEHGAEIDAKSDAGLPPYLDYVAFGNDGHALATSDKAGSDVGGEPTQDELQAWMLPGSYGNSGNPMQKSGVDGGGEVAFPLHDVENSSRAATPNPDNEQPWGGTYADLAYHIGTQLEEMDAERDAETVQMPALFDYQALHSNEKLKALDEISAKVMTVNHAITALVLQKGNNGLSWQFEKQEEDRLLRIIGTIRACSRMVDPAVDGPQSSDNLYPGLLSDLYSLAKSVNSGSLGIRFDYELDDPVNPDNLTPIECLWEAKKVADSLVQHDGDNASIVAQPASGNAVSRPVEIVAFDDDGNTRAAGRPSFDEARMDREDAGTTPPTSFTIYHQGDSAATDDGSSSEGKFLTPRTSFSVYREDPITPGNEGDSPAKGDDTSSEHEYLTARNSFSSDHEDPIVPAKGVSTPETVDAARSDGGSANLSPRSSLSSLSSISSEDVVFDFEDPAPTTADGAGRDGESDNIKPITPSTTFGLEESEHPAASAASSLNKIDSDRDDLESVGAASTIVEPHDWDDLESLDGAPTIAVPEDDGYENLPFVQEAEIDTPQSPIRSLFDDGRSDLESVPAAPDGNAANIEDAGAAHNRLASWVSQKDWEGIKGLDQRQSAAMPAEQVERIVYNYKSPARSGVIQTDDTQSMAGEVDDARLVSGEAGESIAAESDFSGRNLLGRIRKGAFNRPYFARASENDKAVDSRLSDRIGAKAARGAFQAFLDRSSTKRPEKQKIEDALSSANVLAAIPTLYWDQVIEGGTRQDNAERDMRRLDEFIASGLRSDSEAIEAFSHLNRELIEEHMRLNRERAEESARLNRKRIEERSRLTRALIEERMKVMPTMSAEVEALNTLMSLQDSELESHRMLAERAKAIYFMRIGEEANAVAFRQLKWKSTFTNSFPAGFSVSQADDIMKALDDLRKLGEDASRELARLSRPAKS